MQMNYYEILKVSPSASLTEIKQSYHQMVRCSHPDKSGTCDQFNRLQEAWKTLSDESLRENYDVQLKRNKLYQEFPINDEVNLDELEYEDDNYYLECRCGGHYTVPESKVLPGQMVVSCDSCSLVLIVEVEKNFEASSSSLQTVL